MASSSEGSWGVFDGLSNLLPDGAAAVSEAAKSLLGDARSVVSDAASEVGKRLRPEAVRPLLSELRYGPTIPASHRFGANVSQDAFLGVAAYQCVSAYQRWGLQPVTVGLAGLQAALHLSPGGYRLLDVGLNPRRLAVHREWYRLLSSPVLHSSLPHLASNLGGLMVEGSELEARVGSPAMLGLVASVGALSQAIYVGGCWAAAKITSNASLALPYYHGYAVGFSGVLLGLQVLVGYLREAERGPHVEEEYAYTHGRYRCWLSLAITHFMVPDSSLAGHVSGILSGLLHVFVPQACAQLWQQITGRAPPPRLQAGVLRPVAVGDSSRRAFARDMLGHLLVGGGTVLIILMRRRS